MKAKKESPTTGATRQTNHTKDNHFTSQFLAVRDYLTRNTASRYMAAIDTGIPIQNVCRYVDMLRKNDSVAILRIDKCRITGKFVEFLSCNEDLFPKSRQLKLFTDGK